MDVKVSIIVPVFNGERYLETTIKSIVDQTLRECEFIIINDGSTDDTCSIAEKYARIDGRIKIFSQENQGVSVARNVGLNLAQGEYIGFLDADDWVEPDMFERLYNIAKLQGCDVVISNYEYQLEGIKKIVEIRLPKNRILNKGDIIKNIYPCLIEEDILNSIFNKLYKNKVIKYNNLTFPEEMDLGEDAVFNIRFFTYADSCFCSDYTGYHYREVEGSASRNIVAKDYFRRALETYKDDVGEMKCWGFDELYVKRLKAKKLLNSVLSLSYVYLKPNTLIGLNRRYRYTSKMITDYDFIRSLKMSFDEVYATKGRYEKFLLKMIKYKCTPGIYLAVVYSRFRNGQ